MSKITWPIVGHQPVRWRVRRPDTDECVAVSTTPMPPAHTTATAFTSAPTFSIIRPERLARRLLYEHERL